MTARSTLLCAALVGGFFIEACTATNKVADTHPPTLSWDVLDKTDNARLTVDAGGIYLLSTGHDYELTLVAENERGIKRIAIEGGGPREDSTSLEVPLKEENYVRIGNLRTDRKAKLVYVLPSPDASKRRILLTGTAENFSSLSSTSNIILVSK